MFSYIPSVNRSAGSAELGWQVNRTSVSEVYFTSRPGASVALPFYGTGIELSGFAGRPFTVTIDNKTASSAVTPNGTLFLSGTLPQEMHIVNLTVGGSDSSDAEILFSQATINTNFNDSQTVNALEFDARNDTVAFNGNWTKFSNGSAQTSSVGATMLLNFTGIGVAISGPVGIAEDFGTYAVVLDNTTFKWLWTDPISISQTVLFYEGGLDLTQQHTIGIGYTGGSPLVIDSINVWQPSGLSTIPAPASNKSSSHKVVKIVVPIVVVIGVVILAAAFWAYMRRHQRRHTSALTGPFGLRLSRAFKNFGGKPTPTPLTNLGPHAENTAADA